ncbi:MAG: beta-lactamase family protein, partial [Anaerolineaceae bacterium]|nr:beta-lactamase family protein [Anaerolineaceae bacterium]
NMETGVPVALDSIFCVASIAKCFVASAALQLVEMGKVNLDAPLVEYLPYFRLDDERYPQITIRQVLSHTSGMPDMDETEYIELISNPETDDGAAERYVRSLSTRKLIAAPGERFSYSNIAYNVLGDLIAKISGQTFEQYMQEHVLLPAGMGESTFLLEEVVQPRLAVPHLRAPEMIVNPIYPYHRADAPASFLHSTVEDMCNWCITCLNQGIFNGKRILNPSSYDLMWTPAAQWGSPPLYEEIGLGWTLGHFDGVKTVSHGGMGFGWSDFLVILPEKKRAAIILGNEESSARSRIVDAIVHVMLNREPEAGKVSWMIPICHALQEGGIQAAYSWSSELKNNLASDYLFNEDELITLMYQLVSARRIDLAIDVLGLNIYTFPKHMDSYLYQAKLYLQKEDHLSAEQILLKAIEIQPDCASAIELLEQVRGGNLKKVQL